MKDPDIWKIILAQDRFGVNNPNDIRFGWSVMDVYTALRILEEIDEAVEIDRKTDDLATQPEPEPRPRPRRRR